MSKTWRQMWAAAAILSMLLAIPSVARSKPKVDLTLTLEVEPTVIIPGGIVTIRMTVRNAGPDPAGSVLENQREVAVFEKGYNVTRHPPPYELFEPAAGCSAYSEYSEYYPGQDTFQLFSYFFDDIGAGQSRTCVYRVRFLESTQQSFATSWTAIHSANDDDIDPSNDRFDYVFGATPAQIPTLSAGAATSLGIGLILVAIRMRSKRCRRVTLAGIEQ